MDILTGDKVHAAMFVYSITSDLSFQKIRQLNNLMEFPVKVLVGTKSDLVDEREVRLEEGQSLAAEIGAEGFFETSAKTDKEGVDLVFQTLAELL